MSSWLSGRAYFIFSHLWSQVSVHFLRKQHGSFLSSQGREHQVSVSKLPDSGDPVLGGVAFHPNPSSVYSGVPERPGGLSLSSSPATSYRMVPSPGGFLLYQSTLASANRLVCHVPQIANVLSFSLPSGIHWQRGRTPSSYVGAGFRRTCFLRGL